MNPDEGTKLLTLIGAAVAFMWVLYKMVTQSERYKNEKHLNEWRERNAKQNQVGSDVRVAQGQAGGLAAMNGFLATVLGAGAGLLTYHFTGSGWANAAAAFGVSFFIRSLR